MKKLSLILILYLCSIPLFAQSHLQEKRIYLVDVTASMIGKGVVETDDIFDTVKDKLTKTVQGIQNPNTEVTIIPFTNKVHATINGNISAKESLINEISKIKIKRGDTDIATAWQKGLSEIDTTKTNYLFLLTDGLHNCGVEKDSLYNQLRDWQNYANGKFYFAFYVMLTPNAKEKEIEKIVEETSQMWLIESMDMNASFVSTDLKLSANINQNDTLTVHFESSPYNIFKDSVEFSIQMEDNPYYEIDTLDIQYGEQQAKVVLKEKLEHMKTPLAVTTKLLIDYNKALYPLLFFTPEEVKLELQNVGVRTMKIYEYED